MKVIDLARALGLSKSMCYRLRKLGMPTASVEAAKVWRSRNLDPGLTKEIRRPARPVAAADSDMVDPDLVDTLIAERRIFADRLRALGVEDDVISQADDAALEMLANVALRLLIPLRVKSVWMSFVSASNLATEALTADGAVE